VDVPDADCDPDDVPDVKRAEASPDDVPDDAPDDKVVAE
jgi:hypothetical protein